MREPEIITRPSQAYLGVRRTVRLRMDSRGQLAGPPPVLGALVDRIPVLIAEAAQAGYEVAEPPLFRFLEIDMAREMVVEAGVPVAGAGAAQGLAEEVSLGTLPAGRYASTVHVGSPDGLQQATAELLACAAERGLRWDVERDGPREHWGCRLELYRTDPRLEPDPTRWETELRFRLAPAGNPLPSS